MLHRGTYFAHIAHRGRLLALIGSQMFRVNLKVALLNGGPIVETIEFFAKLSREEKFLRCQHHRISDGPFVTVTGIVDLLLVFRRLHNSLGLNFRFFSILRLKRHLSSKGSLLDWSSSFSSSGCGC